MATQALASAVMAGDLTTIQQLYEKSAELIQVNADDVEYIDDLGIEKPLNRAIIAAAIEGGNLDIVKLLLEKGADVNKYSHQFIPAPLFFMVEYLNPKPSEEMATLVYSHADLKLKNSRGQTILYEAQLRSPDYAKSIINRFGVNIAERDIQGHTVVDEVLFHDMYTLMPVYQNYVLSLIQNNDVNTIRNLVLDGFEYVMQGGGVSALDIAKNSGADDVANFIETVPQLMDAIPTLHSAVTSGNLSGVEAIVEPQLATAKDSGGRCALHIAVLYEQLPMVKHLVENFPETLKVTDAYQRTALHYSAGLGDEAFYTCLVTAGADQTARDCCNLTPKEYLTEFANPGSRSNMVDIPGLIERERNAKYGVKIYLKLQYQGMLKAMEAQDTKAAQDIIDNLAFDLEDFIKEGVSNIPLLFLCVEKGAEDVALYLLTKGADPTVRYNGQSLQDAAFKAKMSGLYHTLAESLGFKARRLSAFSETSSMHSENITIPSRPVAPLPKVPAGLSGFESQYLGRVLGQTLTNAIAEVCDKRPWDPIEYLAQWLYRHKAQVIEKNKEAEEAYQLEVERAEADKAHIRGRRMKKEAEVIKKRDVERRRQEEQEAVRQAEEERKRQEMEELRRQQRETDSLAQPPELDTVAEDDEPSAARESSEDQQPNTEEETAQESNEEPATETEPAGGQETEQAGEQETDQAVEQDTEQATE